jgi:glutamate-1-semialdehyde aminotransferase
MVNSAPATKDTLSKGAHIGAGIPQVIDTIASVLPYGHPAAFDLIRRQRNELAAVIVEPVRGTDPHLDAGLWLRELGKVCRKAGVLLILDETTTGFRLSYGGAQELFGLEPDLVTYGGAMGGGLPLGAVAGRAAFMRAFAQDGTGQSIVPADTMSASPLAVAASAAFLTYADVNRSSLYADLDRRTARLAHAFNTTAQALGVSATIRHAGSLFRISLGRPQPRHTASAHVIAAMDAFAVAAIDGGVLVQPGLQGFMSAAHTDEDVDRAAIVFSAALSDLKADGLLVPVDRR